MPMASLFSRHSFLEDGVNIGPDIGAEDHWGLVPPATAADEAGPVVSEYLSFASRREKFEAQFRMLRSLEDEADVLLWSHVTLYVIIEHNAAFPIVRYEEMELSHHRRIGDCEYLAHGHNVAFPRGLGNGHFTDTALNPVTGETVDVPVTVSVNDAGTVFSLDGKREIGCAVEDAAPPHHLFRIEDDMVVIEEIRAPADDLTMPIVEASESWSPKDEFFDPKLKSLSLGTSGAYVFPFPEWAGMTGRKGHMFGMWKGKKLPSVEHLPRDYRDRLERDYPHLLTVDRNRFNA